jgi:membrane-associated phospholipid phosphatase
VVGWTLTFLLLLAGCAPAPTGVAPNADQYQSDVAVAWFDLNLKLIRETPGFSPPVASRALGYLGVALYETVRPGMPGYQSLTGQLNDLKRLPQVGVLARYHWPSAANAALAALTRSLFPTASPENLALIDALEEDYAADFRTYVDGETYWRSVVWGRSMADAILDWSADDGGHEGYANNFPDSYVAPVGQGLWVATAPKFSVALQPYWGANRPFVLGSGSECPADPPIAYSEEATSRFYYEALEVYLVGRDRTPEQTDIALFWSDDAGRTPTPPGHWVSILNQVLLAENATLDKAAEAYAKLGIAVADAFITCWHTKFQYNVLRPITYIQTHIDPTWDTPDITDPVMTPPFPEYTSGHSVQSSAAALVLTSLFGDDYAFTDNTHAALGLAPRTYPSFMAAAEEAAISRLYGGIHYRSAIEQGLVQGQCVGERVLALRFAE